MLAFDRNAGVLVDGEGRRFDPAARVWVADTGARETAPIALRDAAGWLQRESGHRLRAPVGVIGPREANPAQLLAAEATGAALAAMGFAIVCGGRQGIMEAACRGAASQGGVSIGLLPEGDPALANPFVTVPIATGIGEARNALVARAAFCLVAIGDSYGTLSEVALGLQFGKRVFGLLGAAQIAGVRHCDSVNAAMDAVAAHVLGLADKA